MNRIKINKKILLLIIFGLVLLFFLISKILINNKKIVYTKQKDGTNSLPYININTEDIKRINEKLKSDYEIIKNNNNESYMKYEYEVEDNNLSLLVEEGIKEEGYILEKNFLTYNINTKTKKELSFDEVLYYYGLDYNEVKETIESELKKQYESEVNEGYIEASECNYECYLSFRKYNSIDENLKIYKKAGKIYGYLNIQHGFIYYSDDDYPEVKVLYELK